MTMDRDHYVLSRLTFLENIGRMPKIKVAVVPSVFYCSQSAVGLFNSALVSRIASANLARQHTGWQLHVSRDRTGDIRSLDSFVSIARF